MIALVRRLRSPDPGILGQAVRFGLTGGTVAAVYLLSTLLLANVVGVAFQAALALGFTLAVATHFLLQRLFVWVHATGFALSIEHQAGRYLAVAITLYALTALITATLPGLLGVSVYVVYVVTTVALSASNFLILRARVFHAGPDEQR